MLIFFEFMPRFLRFLSRSRVLFGAVFLRLGTVFFAVLGLGLGPMNVSKCLGRGNGCGECFIDTIVKRVLHNCGNLCRAFDPLRIFVFDLACLHCM